MFLIKMKNIVFALCVLHVFFCGVTLTGFCRVFWGKYIDLRSMRWFCMALAKNNHRGELDTTVY